MQFQLDSQALKALSSKSRVDILKLLVHRKHMQSELSAKLGLSVPTVKEHLVALEKADLVERHDEGRKWKYYSLTKKGRAVLEPQETTILLVLGLFILSVIGGILTFFKTLAPASFMAEQTMAKTASLAMTAPVVSSATLSWPQYVFAGAAVVFAIMLAILIRRYLAHKQQLGKNLTKKQGIY